MYIHTYVCISPIGDEFDGVGHFEWRAQLSTETIRGLPKYVRRYVCIRICTHKYTYILVHSCIHAKVPYIPCIRIPGRGVTYTLPHLQGKSHTCLSSLAPTLLRRIPDAPQPKIDRPRHTATFQGAASMGGVGRKRKERQGRGREEPAAETRAGRRIAFRFVSIHLMAPSP